MRRALLAACALSLAAGAGAQEHRHHEEGEPGGAEGSTPASARNSYANPSAVIATELAFAKMAQEQGEWAAFAHYGATDAVMFMPQMVYAQQWLKGRPSPPTPIRWQAREVWSSCDGSLMVSHSGWQIGSVQGWFTTVWQRQASGEYKWILGHSDRLSQPLEAPDMIAAHIADCPPRGPRPPTGKPAKATKPPKELPPPDPAHRSGRSGDGSLLWDVAIGPDGTRTLTINWTKDGKDSHALVETVTPPKR